MASLNKVFMIGRLTKDPELRYLPNGTPKAELRLATSREYKDRNGEKQQDTCYVDIVVWARQAEIASQFLQKGRQVFVEGRLDYQEWEGQDGNKRSKHQIVADRVQFLDGKGQGGGMGGDEEEAMGGGGNFGGGERSSGGFGGNGGGNGGGGSFGGQRPRAYQPRGNAYGQGGNNNGGGSSWSRGNSGGGAQTYGGGNQGGSYGHAPVTGAPAGAPQAAVQASAPPANDMGPARDHGGPADSAPSGSAPPMAEAMGLNEEDLPF